MEAFRRSESPYEAARFRLRGLDPDAGYVVTNADAGHEAVLTGRELMDEGLSVSMTRQPDSAVITYQRRS